MLTLAAGSFATLDWIVVGAYMLVLLGSGVWFARMEPKSASEYFLAGRRMPAWAVAISIIASSLSVATFIGVPEQTFKDGGNLTYLSTNIGGFLAVLVVAYVFIPAFYKQNCTTIYEVLEHRFGQTGKLAASATFMIGRLFASGARVYIAAIPLAMIMFGVEESREPVYLISAIAALSVVAVGYTLIGGIASVIWTDVIQTVVLLTAILAGVALMLAKIPAPIDQIVATLNAPGPGLPSKLTVLDFSLDPAAEFTVWTALLGFMLLNLAAYGTDHEMVQRMLTCKNAVQGGRSAITAIVLAVPIVALFLIVGLLLHVFYKRPDLMMASAPTYAPPDGQRTLLTFVLNEFPTGLAGLMVAGLFAVGLGSLNSAINAMAATAIKDFYMRIEPGRTDRHYLVASRWATLAWGVALAGFAVLCIYWMRAHPQTTLLSFALKVMTFAYSGLLAVFVTALFTRRGNTQSCVAALVTGFVVIGLMDPIVWSLWAGQIAFRGETLADLKIAFPWHMLLATVLATTVCCIPGPRPSDSQTPLPTA